MAHMHIYAVHAIYVVRVIYIQYMAHMHTCMHTHIARMHACMHTHIARVHACTHAHMHAYMHMHTCVRTYTNAERSTQLAVPMISGCDQPFSAENAQGAAVHLQILTLFKRMVT